MVGVRDWGGALLILVELLLLQRVLLRLLVVGLSSAAGWAVVRAASGSICVL